MSNNELITDFSLIRDKQCMICCNSFSLKDSEFQSILCDSFEYTFKKDNSSQTKFTIPMAKLTSLAENLKFFSFEKITFAPTIFE